MRVKICGITSLDDGLAAVQAGADALGLVFYPPSPRYIPPARARLITDALPPFVSLVGLFVNAPREEMIHIFHACRLDHLQLHGDETPDQCQGLPGRLIKAIRVAEPADLAGLERYPVDGLLLDAKVKGVYGGSGQCFDWSMIRQQDLPRPVILAGGLDAENVATAVAVVQPYAVDVSSGVEAAPGIKDHARMARFVRASRERLGADGRT